MLEFSKLFSDLYLVTFSDMTSITFARININLIKSRLKYS